MSERQNIILCQEYEAEFGPSEQSDGGDKDEAEVFFFLLSFDLFKLLSSNLN